MQIEIIPENGKIVVISPYDRAFVAYARDFRGRWDGTRKAWAFPAALREEVVKALNVCYGYVDNPNERRVVLKVTVNKELIEHTGPVELGPYTLANARGRDSGARPGPDVALIAGSIGSTGSVKNWRSKVSKGATFKIVDVPESVAQRLKDIAATDTFTANVRVDKIDRPMVKGDDGWWKPDVGDGKPDDLVYSGPVGTATLHENVYYWVRQETRHVFTVEDVS